MRRCRGFVGGAAVAVLVLAGCGDDGDGDAISEEEFVEQANEICEEGEERLEAIFESFGDEEPSEDELVDAIGELADEIQDQIDDIRDLGEPEGIADDVDAALDAAEDVLDGMRDDPEAFVASTEDPFADVNEQLTDIGITSCAD